MRKIELNIFILLLLISLIVPVGIFAEKKAPTSWNDIEIKDEKTGLILTEYYQALDIDKMPDEINTEFMEQQGIRTPKYFKTIEEHAKKDFTFKVEELSENDPNMVEFLNKYKGKIFETKGKLNCFGYKITIEPTTDRPTGSSKLKIPISEFFEIKNDDGTTKETYTRRPIWEHGLIVCEKSKEYAINQRDLKEIRYSAWNYNEKLNIKDGYEVIKKPAEIVIPEINKEHYIFIASRKEMPQIPENLMPGTYEVPTIARKQNDVGSYSMASGSLKKIAKIKVNKYGQRFLYPQFQNMWLMGLNGHLQKLQYHDTVGAAELKEAKIIDYYKDSTDGYKEYPQTFEIPLRNNQATKEVYVTVDAMGDGSQYFWLTLNNDGFLEGTRSNPKGLIIKTIDLSDGKYLADVLPNDFKKKDLYYDEKIFGKDSNLKYEITIKDGKATLELNTNDTLISLPTKETNYYNIKADQLVFGESKEIEAWGYKQRTKKWFSMGKLKVTNKITIKNIDLNKLLETKSGLIAYLGNNPIFKYNEETKKYERKDTTFSIPSINFYRVKSLNEKPILKTKELEDLISQAEKINQGNKTKKAFDELKSAIGSAKSALDATEQKQIDDAKTELQNAINTFNKSAEEKPEVNPNAEKIYSLLVKVKNYGDINKDSMAQEAIISPAKVKIKGNTATVEVSFRGIHKKWGNNELFGHLTNLFTFKDNNPDGSAIPCTPIEHVNEKGLDGQLKEFPRTFRFTMDKDKFLEEAEKSIYIKVWVDAMDEIAGKGPGGGEQKARLIFDMSSMKESGGNGGASNQDDISSSSTDIKEIRGMLKDSLNTANAVSASKGADSFLTIAIANANNVLANPKASASEIRSAINNLNTASARNNPTGSANNNANQNNGNNPFNNNSWGNNNNNPWNNNNWGNNNFGFNNNNWGNNNNSSWGNNQNNNNQNSGPVTIQYEVPVEALNAYQSGVYSMANNALNHTARVEERNGQFRYSIQFVPMQKEFGGKTFTGHLYNFFVYDGNKYQAQQSQGNVWSWVMNGKYDKVKGAVWVDAMDEIAGKGPGGGEQDVILSFNWNNAKEVGRVGGNNNQQNQNQQNQNQLNGQNQNNQASSQGFTDINGHWAKNAIDYVVGKKYFAGLSKTEFGPNKAITRGQFVTVLGRMLNVDKSQYQSQKFSDVKADAYYGPYIAWASQKGIVAGLGGNNFAPDQELTREQMALIMSKFLKVSGKNLKVKGNVKDFKDQGQISSWAKDSINEMLKLGVVNGMDDGTFAPKQAFTRAQVAQVLYNIDHN